MADYTKNYNLKKPALEDFVDIADLNGNMDKIDEALTQCSDGLLTAAEKEKLDEVLNPADENTLFAVPGEDGNDAVAVKKDKETVIRDNLNVGENNYVHGKGAVAIGRKSIAAPGTLYTVVSTDVENNRLTLDKAFSPSDMGKKAVLHATAATRLPKEVNILEVDETGTMVTVSAIDATYNTMVLLEEIGTNGYNYAAHAEGAKTIACGATGSHAEGRLTIASGLNAHAEGYRTKATEQYAHAEGGYTEANQPGTHAEGYYTKANSQNQHAQGKYNQVDAEGKYAHIVGNGSSDTARSNAHTLDWQGNAWFAGDVESAVGGKLSEKVDKRYVDGAVADGNTIVFENFTKKTFERIKPQEGLSEKRYGVSAATIGEYALFAGGYTANKYISTVDAYDTKLTRSKPISLGTARHEMGAATVGNYALFAGGRNSGNTGAANLKTVDAYDASLTHTLPTTLNSNKATMGAATVGNYAIFAGGHTGNNGYTSIVNAYDSSLTRSIPTSLNNAVNNLAATSVGNHALFAGGYLSDGYSDDVNAYDVSLTRSLLSGLSLGRAILAATTIGNYALFGGGFVNGIPYANVDVYSSSLTKLSVAELSEAKYNLMATTVVDYALFAGGRSGIALDTVDSYDTSLSKKNVAPLSTGIYSGAATSLENYALFAGGYTDVSTLMGVVNVYEFVGGAKITVPPFSKYLFDGITDGEEMTFEETKIISQIPLNGYIKKITKLSGAM